MFILLCPAVASTLISLPVCDGALAAADQYAFHVSLFGVGLLCGNLIAYKCYFTGLLEFYFGFQVFYLDVNGTLLSWCRRSHVLDDVAIADLSALTSDVVGRT